MSNAPSSSAASSQRSHILIEASSIARLHTVLALSAFLVALFLGCTLHYVKIVKNGVAGYPQEWFPSVSATIGDWYPERNVFQILIALTSGPRFALVCLQYYVQRSQKSTLPAVVFVVGLIRTLSCGGWVYITSSDDHDVHDIFMILYMLCDLPWMVGGIQCTSIQSRVALKKRKLFASAFFGAIPPMIYFFIQHKVHRIPGAYTHYSFFEWGLIIFDILFDSATEDEFKAAKLQVSLGSNLPHSTKILHVEVKEQPKIIEKQVNEKQASEKPSDTIWNKVMQTQGEVLSFVSDLYLSFIFWTIFTSLIPTLFYFSVWELGIAGHELALLATLSPVLFFIPPFFEWACTHQGMTALHLLSFAGLAAYILPKPLQRLAVVAPATAIAVLRQAAAWSKADHGYQAAMTGLGFLLHSLSKHWNHTNNPLWPSVHETSGGWNKTGLILAMLALWHFSVRHRYSEGDPSRAVASVPAHGWLNSGASLGAYLFTLHTLLGDCSTLVAWSWTGYKNGVPNGPLPHLYGSVILIAEAVGLLLGISLPSENMALTFTDHPLWFSLGAFSAFVMCAYKDWAGFSGSIAFAFFAMSITPLVISRAAASRDVPRTLAFSMLVYCLLSLASVWTVAYAFVPGGVYLRERTNLVIIVQMICLALSFRWPFFHFARVANSVPTTASSVSLSKAVLACVATLAALGTLYRLPTSAPQPHRIGYRMIRAGIWTVHFAVDNEGRDSQRRITNLIRDMELDVIGLLETDLHRTVFGNRDLTRVIIEDLNYYIDLGPGPNSHTWGCTLLSKFPIVNSTHHLLPSPEGELAPAIEALLDVYGTLITVVVSHNGQEETPLDRTLQSIELGRIMSQSYPRPVIFLGYVVTKPHAEKPAPYKYLIEDGRMHDIDEDDRERWCEYILYRGLYRTSYARISRSTVTDTELQVGQFVLPRHSYSVTNETREARYLRSFKETLSPEHWFPMSYYGNIHQGGVNGHFYHVFNTPLYYNIPEDAVL